MPRKKAWTTEERRVGALAYLSATNDCVHGKDQSSMVFWTKVEDKMKQIPSTEPFDTDRTAGAIKSFMSNTLFRDIHLFSKSLQMVVCSKPSGVSQDQIINMAVAIHQGVVTCRDYKMRDYNSTNWLNYKAWLVLKNCRKFSHPLESTDEIATALSITPSLSASASADSTDNVEEVGEETTAMVENAAMGVDMFKQIGQKQAKRERFQIKDTASATTEELKKSRVVMDERNKLIGMKNSIFWSNNRSETVKPRSMN